MAPAVAVNIALIVIVCAWVAWRIASPTKALRLRNALRAETGTPTDFDWTPDHPPADFKVERCPADPRFDEVLRALEPSPAGSDWDRALRIANHLVENARDTGPVRADLHETYQAIRAGHGYCADFVRVFMALAHSAGVPVRQWGFSFDGFGGHGHTIVEIYDRARRQWLMLDVYNNFHASDDATGKPLGALEFRESLLGRRAPAKLVANGPGRPGFVHEATALDYYRRGVPQWYLLLGNNVLSNDRHRIVRKLGRLYRPLARFAANAIDVQPRIRVYATPDNANDVRRLFALRRELRIVAVIAVVLLVALAVQIGGGFGAAKARA